MDTPTRENLKNKAKIMRAFLKEKCNVDPGHSQCIELTSKLFGFKDWNTASATLKTKAIPEDKLPIKTRTVGELMSILEKFDKDDSIDVDYEFKISDLDLDDVESPNDEIYQEFSLSLKGHTDGIVILGLELEHESITFN